MRRILWNKRKKVELWVGGVLLLATSLGGLSGWGNPLEYLFLDVHFNIRAPRAIPEQLAIIGVDETSLDSLGQWPWPREHHATLVSLLRYEAFRPKVLAYDLLFESRSQESPSGDLSLIYQVQSFPNPFISAYFFERNTIGLSEKHPDQERLAQFALSEIENFPELIETAHRASLPYRDLAHVSDLAFVNTPLGTDGKTRHVQLLIRYQNAIYPSIDLLMALRALEARLEDVQVKSRRVIIQNSRIGAIEIPVNARGEMLINYYSGSRNTRIYSFAQILNEGRKWMGGGDSPEILRSLKDKIVIVGVTALGLGDRRVTPVARYETGVNLHAQAVANILQKDFLRELPRGVIFLFWFIPGVLAMTMSLFLHIKKSLPAVLLLILVCFFTAHRMFLSGLWAPFAGPLIVILTVYVGGICTRYFTALEELKRTHKQLTQSAKMAALGELSAGMAHEFRNIVQAISLNLEYATHPDSSPDKARKSMEKLQEVTESAKIILNGLLIFARKSESHFVKASIERTIQNTLLIVKKDLELQQIEVIQDLELTPNFAFDAGQISQVMMNLIRNARDAMRGQPHKRIMIRLRKDSRMAILEISDNGPGLPEKIRKHLFQPFVTTKPEGQGTGLGLSVCHGIIHSHGGEITVRSSRDTGTTWIISLPIKS